MVAPRGRVRGAPGAPAAEGSAFAEPVGDFGGGLADLAAVSTALPCEVEVRLGGDAAFTGTLDARGADGFDFAAGVAAPVAALAGLVGDAPGLAAAIGEEGEAAFGC